MSVFSALTVGFFAAAFYLQEIMQAQKTVFMTKECAYRQLDLLQRHADTATLVRISSTTIEFSHQRSSVTVGRSEGDNLVMRHVHGSLALNQIQTCGSVTFTRVIFGHKNQSQTLTERATVEVAFEFTDAHEKTFVIQEKIIVAPIAPIVYF
jgi:hypothetical protein